jgi:hypothetical protein
MPTFKEIRMTAPRLRATHASAVWLLLLTCWAPAQVSFTSVPALPVGSTPTAVACADFDGNGVPDIVCANRGSDSVSLLLNFGGGAPVTWTIPTVLPAQPLAVVTDDFDLDGNVDFATCSIVGGMVSLFLGDGAGGFTLSGSCSTGSAGPENLDSGDLDQDGRPDLVVANVNVNGNTLSVLLQSGAAFVLGPGMPMSSPAGIQYPFDVAIADFDGDLVNDVAVAYNNSAGAQGAVAIYRNTGGAVLAPPTIYMLGANTHPRALEAADLDGDGDIDLVAPGQSNGVVCVLDNTGGAFTVRNVSVPGAGVLQGAAVADLDGDCDLDVVVSDFSTSMVHVLVNQGGLTFLPGGSFAVGSMPRKLVACDVNNDLLADILTPNTGSGTVSILLNATPAPPAPQPTPAGTSTITFSPDWSCAPFRVMSVPGTPFVPFLLAADPLAGPTPTPLPQVGGGTVTLGVGLSPALSIPSLVGPVLPVVPSTGTASFALLPYGGGGFRVFVEALFFVGPAFQTTGALPVYVGSTDLGSPLNAAGLHNWNGELDPTRTVYYFSRGAAQAQIHFALVGSGATFSAPAPVGSVNVTNNCDDPTVLPDGTGIVFGAAAVGGLFNLYLATGNTASPCSLSPPTLLQNVNGGASHGPSVLAVPGSPGTGDLFFASDRGGLNDIFFAPHGGAPGYVPSSWGAPVALGMSSLLGGLPCIEPTVCVLPSGAVQLLFVSGAPGSPALYVSTNPSVATAGSPGNWSTPVVALPCAGAGTSVRRPWVDASTGTVYFSVDSGSGQRIMARTL